ncbi:HNH endonuclease [Bacillus canaveralius]|uniref:HNH endonuclease n=1 Tax=Bacillus canaveralius TaxID=1403243 RepID=A0A2N5GKE7_9BACI|nr:HNH endonuclease signature motif containing protein [Bacillus canaveralius]PLR81851.1 HNH endonuclease [Bacillus canaveralius]PLR95005.1 HNH endonuclease [Bacillus canaveralius]
MPRQRPPKEVWHENIRPMVFYRDGQRCTRCGEPITLKTCHIDHKISGKLGSNSIKNLRTLCRVCHTLRADLRHGGMKGNALNQGIIGPGWREQAWE